ncbi:MAG TPA: hypothetical protein VFF94_05095, partial [Novosphingobium sp.]|nr:hypothetical protein [Novosphingobium sp.]
PPPRIDHTGPLIARFTQAYRRAKSPRMVIFWNRALTDDVATSHELYARSHTDSQANVQSGYGWAHGDSASNSETRLGISHDDPGRRDTPLAESDDFGLEQGFTDALAQAGVRLVDRTAIMRTGALRGGTWNLQALETRSILAHAELVVEVAPLADGSGGAGSFKVVVRNLASGRLVANVQSRGEPPAQVQPYVAGPSGFVRAAPHEPTPYEAGRQIGLDVMAALAGRL